MSVPPQYQYLNAQTLGELLGDIESQEDFTTLSTQPGFVYLDGEHRATIGYGFLLGWSLDELSRRRARSDHIRQ